jgi:hypothetical protein
MHEHDDEGSPTRPTNFVWAIVAYADDITILVTSTVDFPIIDDAIHQYEWASGPVSTHRSPKPWL